MQRSNELASTGTFYLEFTANFPSRGSVVLAMFQKVVTKSQSSCLLRIASEAENTGEKGSKSTCRSGCA
jgi:hypothetical protein